MQVPRKEMVPERARAQSSEPREPGAGDVPVPEERFRTGRDGNDEHLCCNRPGLVAGIYR